MSREFTLEGQSYKLDELSEKATILYEQLIFVYKSIEELNGKHALLTKAKNAYISDLKTEIIQGRTGVDLGALFSDD